MLEPVLAHAGGWDEILLLFVLPPVVFFIAYRMTQAGSDGAAHDDAEVEPKPRL